MRMSVKSAVQRLQRSQLDYVVSSRAAATTLAENYVGLPFEDEGRVKSTRCRVVFPSTLVPRV
jgi:hypothetical protein